MTLLLETFKIKLLRRSKIWEISHQVNPTDFNARLILNNKYNLERKVKSMTEEFNDEKQGISSWVQDNLRIIISILIVIFVAGFIYSYSNRSTEEKIAINEETSEETISEEEILEDILNQEADEETVTEEEISEEIAAEEDATEEVAAPEEEITEEEIAEEVAEENIEETIVEDAEVIEEATEETVAEEPVVTAEETQETQQEENSTEETQEISAVQTSQETEGSFVESAQAGDGLTHLARRAMNNYLEKSPNSSLTAEHKVYIEDYLRKKVGFQDGVHVGTSVEFSKSLIQEAIASSEQLTDSQLQNIHKYAVLVN